MSVVASMRLEMEMIPSPESDGGDGWVRLDDVVGRWKGEEKGSSRKKRQHPMEVLEVC